MVNKQIVGEWLDKADGDFEFAHINLKENRGFFAQICFFFHQAAEKYLKAYIVAFDLEFKKLHDLSELLAICKRSDPSFGKLQEECAFLTGFYIDTRYPVHWPVNFNLATTQRAESCVIKIGEFVKKKLSLL